MNGLAFDTYAADTSTDTMSSFLVTVGPNHPRSPVGEPPRPAR